nr:reverse transcriptase domain-containing protein [Tanacetum cinerariifolium]
MRTRSQSRNNFTQQEASPAIVEPLRIELPFLEDQFQEDPPEVSKADNRTMAELLQAPTEGYEDAIVIPEITANNFELKHGLINLVQNKQFFGHDKEDPHAHIRYFNKITSTMRVPNVPSSSIKLMLFPFSLEGAARIWLEKEPPRSTQTWDDLVSKFINQFFPPSKTTNFYEAWERFNDLLRACPHHGFSELHQLNTFYNALNVNDQDSLNSAASTSSSTPVISSDVAEIKDMVRALLLDKKNQSPAPTPSATPTPIKAVESNCVTCGGAHSYQNCPATQENAYRDNIQEYVSQAAVANYNQGNTGFRPQMVANQIRPPGFPPHQNNQNNFNRGNNFNQNRGGNFNQSNFNQSSFNQGQLNRPQNQYQNLQNQMATLTEMMSKLVSANTASSYGSVAPVSAPMPNLKPSIPYPSRRDNEKSHDQANEQIKKFYEIFKDMSFEISFTDALILMPKFASTLKALIENKEKLSEMARTTMNEHCSAVILNKLPRKLGDPRKFLIPCEFSGMDECLALADLGASINLMPLSVCEGLSLFELKHDKMPRECLKIIESKSKVRQSRAKAVVAKVGTSSSTPVISSKVAELKDMVRALLLDKKNQSPAPTLSTTLAPVKAIESNCTLPGNTVTNPKEDLKGITTRSGVAYQGPKTPSPSKQETKVTKDQVQNPSSQNNAPVQPSVIQPQPQSSVSEPVVAPVSAPMPNLKPSTPYPLRRDNEKHRDQANEQIKKFYEIFKDMRLSLPELTPTSMTLELADRSVSKPIGIAKDISFKVGVFHFPADFVVVDFEPDPRVPLILGRCFLKTSRALIDVHKGELTLRIGNETITYNLDQTVRYSANYNQMTANKIDVVEEYSQEVLGFSNVTDCSISTPQNEPIVFVNSHTLTPFGDSDFLLFEEADAFLAILYSEPSPPLPNQDQNLPSFKEELKAYEAKTVKSSIEEPLEVELKDLPYHLEYAFLEGDNKLPVIIAKELRSEKKAALIKVLKSHKRAIAWKLSDI